MDWEMVSKKLSIQNWIILMILSSISFFFCGSSFTLGVILGGLIIIANFGMLQHTVLSVFSSQGVMKKKKISTIVRLYFRLAILGIIIYMLIASRWVNPVGLVVGLSVVVVSIISLAIASIWKTSSGKVI